MSAPPLWKTDQERFAFYRRRDHSNIEALQNFVIGEIARRAALEYMKANPEAEKPPDFTMPPNVRHLVSALQGAHGGGQQPFEEFERDYLTIGAQLQFTGQEATVRARVRDWVDALDEWQYAVGVQLFVICKGGALVFDERGKQKLYADSAIPVRTKTKFIDYLKPRVDEGVQRARFSEQWRGDAVKGIKPHPGLALVAQVAAVIESLPQLGSREESGTEKKTRTKQPVVEYMDAQRGRLCQSAEKVADAIEEKAGDSDLWLEKLEIEIKRLRESRLRTRPARRDMTSLAVVQGEIPPPTATSYKCDSEEAKQPAPAAPAPVVEETPTPLCDLEVTQGFIDVSANSVAEGEPEMLEWALFWAARGIPVFPLHEVYDGICTCTCADHWRKREGKWVMKCEGEKHFCGVECSRKGKHPRTDRKIGLHNGLKIASTDPAQIRIWWGQYSTANIGGRMLGKVGVDVDPKHGGNASLSDLCDKYGQDFLDEAWRNRSGSAGDHFIYDNPTGESFPNSAGKIGPGIDTRGDEGYLVMPPSLHLSGRRYAVVSPREFPPVPQFIIDALKASKSDREINFQDRPAHSGIGHQREKFLDGFRNDGLLAYGLGRMRYAWEQTEAEHYQQLSRVNQLRCVPPLDDDEVRGLAEHIANDYAYRYGANVGEKGVAA